jgi:methenyltetrahydromethanopterin cyclohydrolase
MAMSHAVTGIVQSAAVVERSLRALRTAGRVRLDDAEAAAVAAAVDGIIADSVELFGSRTDLAGRGGDVDLLILTSAPRFETARRVSSRFFMQCEERVDVVVLDPDQVTAGEAVFLASLRRVRIT